MRSGKLLAEEAPHVLLTMYGCTSLEEVFLKLSRKQGQVGGCVGAAVGQTDNNISNNISLATLNWGKKEPISVTEESGVVGLNFHQSKEVLVQESNGHLDVSWNPFGRRLTMVVQFAGKASSAKHGLQEMCEDCGNCSEWTTTGKIRALLVKNFLRMWRNVGVMLFIFALPVMQVILFCLAIGGDPRGLKLAIVNNEVEYLNQTFQECDFEEGCKFSNLSCRYVHAMNSSTISKVPSREEIAGIACYVFFICRTTIPASI